MALVEIRRFYDRNEAFIAHTALLNADLFSVVRDNGYANMIFGTAIATGGYGLFVDANEVEAARGVLTEADPPSPEALQWTGHPQHLTSLPMAALGTAAGMFVGAPTAIGLPKPPRIVVIGTLASVLLVVVSLGVLFASI